jgi:hypothetical protein
MSDSFDPNRDAAAGSAVDGLTLNTELPVVFTPDTAPEPPPASGDRLYNLRILQAYDVIEDHAHIERAETETPLAGDIRRLDTKLSLLLQLFGELLRDRKQPPPPRPLRLYRQGVDCSVREVVPSGTCGLMEIFVHPSIPLPVRWRATAGERLSEGLQRFEFEPLGELESDQLERLIFLAHRQQVADARRERR